MVIVRKRNRKNVLMGIEYLVIGNAGAEGKADLRPTSFEVGHLKPI